MTDLSKVDVNIMGPPDIEREIGLTGGHIFQGDILPNFLWENRLSSSTPMQGNCTNKSLIFNSFFNLMSSSDWLCILYKKGFICVVHVHIQEVRSLESMEEMLLFNFSLISLYPQKLEVVCNMSNIGIDVGNV
jgi:hypothetical protein